MFLILIFILVHYNQPVMAQIQIGDDIEGEDSDNWSGYSVSLSEKGNIIAIGAPINSHYNGHVRVFLLHHGL